MVGTNDLHNITVLIDRRVDVNYGGSACYGRAYVWVPTLGIIRSVTES